MISLLEAIINYQITIFEGRVPAYFICPNGVCSPHNLYDDVSISRLGSKIDRVLRWIGFSFDILAIICLHYKRLNKIKWL